MLLESCYRSKYVTAAAAAGADAAVTSLGCMQEISKYSFVEFFYRFLDAVVIFSK